MNLRLGTSLWFGALLLVPLAQAQALPAAPSSTSPAQVNPHTNAVAAVVNGEIVTLSQLLKQVDPKIQGIFDELASKYPDDPATAQKEFHQRIQALETETLHGMAEKLLIIQDFLIHVPVLQNKVIYNIVVFKNILISSYYFNLYFSKI